MALAVRTRLAFLPAPATVAVTRPVTPYFSPYRRSPFGQARSITNSPSDRPHGCEAGTRLSRVSSVWKASSVFWWLHHQYAPKATMASTTTMKKPTPAPGRIRRAA
jgi:hypothetical protein